MQPVYGTHMTNTATIRDEISGDIARLADKAAKSWDFSHRYDGVSYFTTAKGEFVAVKA